MTKCADVASLRIIVPDETEMTAPTFKAPLQDLSIKDGDPLLLKAVVDGEPEPSVEWFKNGEVGRSFTDHFSLIAIRAVTGKAVRTLITDGEFPAVLHCV